MKCTLAIGVLFSCLALAALAAPSTSSPQGMERTYEQNYKDMVLATCIANAYKGDKSTAMDAGSSVTALREWAYYDLEKSPDAVKALIDQYLARHYTNPLVESEVKGVKFDLLKCLDLYHSKELNALVKEVVIQPGHTYIQDNK
ncbi:type VI secretion system amidase immunity protein Tai4 [Pseudomonas syringae]|uniref:type VI secretion system amidase immunity protein Tai4 n=1 Tax=Pseudomonas syringae TaxID=317 RepID=UPI001CA80A71|nr:type VI secretion system amidase immunity protein Tai4 [Pseudomonas syringae]MCI3943233.1 type VI secretion system amidase immunity protein Tai4 [Pseudomonas syringae]